MLDHDIDQIEITVDHCNAERLRNKRNAGIRKAIRHEKPAYVKHRAEKAEAKRRVPAERQMAELRSRREPHRILAARITTYVIRNGGEIRGDSLPEIHTKFAQVLIGDDSKQAIARIGAAVQFAIGKGWLEQKEASTFVVPTTVAA